MSASGPSRARAGSGYKGDAHEHNELLEARDSVGPLLGLSRSPRLSRTNPEHADTTAQVAASNADQQDLSPEHQDQEHEPDHEPEHDSEQSERPQGVPRRRTLSSWASLHDKRSNKIKRWQTLPLRGAKPRSSVTGASAVPSVDAVVPDGVTVKFSSEEKNEVDLSIAALESLAESLSDKNTSLDPLRIKEQILNVIFLLQKFQVDATVSSALREVQIKRLFTRNLMQQRLQFSSHEDQEVAQWISENVFAPNELRRILSDEEQITLAGGVPPAPITVVTPSPPRVSEASNSIFQSLGKATGAVLAPSASLPSQSPAATDSRMSTRRSSVPPHAEVTAPESFAPSLASRVPAVRYRAPYPVDLNVRAASDPYLGSFEEESVQEPAPEPSPEPSHELATRDEGVQTRSRQVSTESLALQVSVDTSTDEDRVQAQIDYIDRLFAFPELTKLLGMAESWPFDIFHFVSIVPDFPLVTLSTYLFQTLGLLDALNIPKRVFVNFMTKIESKYRNNAYHNAIHATDVLQNFFSFFRMSSFSQKLSTTDVFAGLIAAAIHDVGHPGTNNAFQIAINSPLAIRYNDRSVLENMHLAEAFTVLREPDCDIFCGLSADARKEVRESIITMVLATDMQVHLHVMSEMRSAIDAKKEAGTWFDSKNRQDTLLCLKVGLHCADVANPAKPIEIYKQWVDRLVTEWYIQGDEERRLGLPVSPLMDRDKPNVPKSQVGFMDFFIRPLFETWLVVIPETKECMDHLVANRQYYESLVQAQAHAQAQAQAQSQQEDSSSSESKRRDQAASPYRRGRNTNHSLEAESPSRPGSGGSARSTPASSPALKPRSDLH